MALQFEWAWQKPYLSRHLRTHGTASSASQHVALPLFTDTPLNQVAVSADGCKALACTSVQSNLLVARALLHSEPFSAWGLRITFFEEYCWAAWLRLERDLSRQVVAKELYERVGLQRQRSRLSRLLPPSHLTPSVICDFAGVDGTRESMLEMGDEEKHALKLEEARKAVQEGRSPGQWPEKLPRTLSVRAMGATWDALYNAPLAPVPLHPESTPTRRMRLNDDDQAELAWRRYEQVLHRSGHSTEAVQPGTSMTPNESCGLCQAAVSLPHHLTYTTCPSPFSQLQPKADPNLSQRSSSQEVQVRHCAHLFHIQCLAQHFLAQQSTGSDEGYLLPTHGCCPRCGDVGRESDMNTWIEVIRAVYRRKERLEREWAAVLAARAKEDKRLRRGTAEKRTPAAVTCTDAGTGKDLPKLGLLGALDQIHSKASKPGAKRTFTPASMLLRDPVHAAPSAKRSSLLCSLDNAVNMPSARPVTGEFKAKRPKADEVIDLT